MMRTRAGLRALSRYRSMSGQNPTREGEEALQLAAIPPLFYFAGRVSLTLPPPPSEALQGPRSR